MPGCVPLPLYVPSYIYILSLSICVPTHACMLCVAMCGYLSFVCAMLSLCVPVDMLSNVQAVEHAKEIIAGLDVQQDGVVVEEVAVGGNSKVNHLASVSGPPPFPYTCSKDYSRRPRTQDILSCHHCVYIIATHHIVIGYCIRNTLYVFAQHICTLHSLSPHTINLITRVFPVFPLPTPTLPVSRLWTLL